MEGDLPWIIGRSSDACQKRIDSRFLHPFHSFNRTQGPWCRGQSHAGCSARDSEAAIPERDVRPPNCSRRFESHHSSSVHPRISTDHRPVLRLHLLCIGIGSEKKSLSQGSPMLRQALGQRLVSFPQEWLCR
jgi:hypothetical protein